MTAVGGGGDGRGVLGIETRVGGRSVGTPELDDESETFKVEEAKRVQRKTINHRRARYRRFRILRVGDPILHFPATVLIR